MNLKSQEIETEMKQLQKQFEDKVGENKKLFDELNKLKVDVDCQTLNLGKHLSAQTEKINIMSDQDLENLKQLSLPKYVVGSEGAEWIKQLETKGDFEKCLKND